MNKNKEIKQNLERRLAESLNSFKSIKDKEPIFESLFTEFQSFNFETYKKQIEQEIQKNLAEWWTNPEQGIIPTEELFAILFEYDYFFQKDVEATSYGIGAWKDFKIQTDEFDMGFDYDFTTEFYACPGISVNFFNPLEILDHNNLEEKYSDIEELDGYDDIIQLFKTKGMISIHEVLERLDSEGIFNSLNCKENFMFIIDEHDSGEVFPLLIKSKIEEQSSDPQPSIENISSNKSHISPRQSKRWWEIWR
ncbi:hypothetical protein [Portibacter lacus]|uniref:Uncharacterized protein n=1 Tax=Portibacter lacus TaxID=1099794 RepID=A0AA37WDK7_9BACT|nr:hypothetical protein [Portibacter lacus]GLR16167.1 hypothetical protein GCM10007940_07820 [Portibacter lacus]